MTPKQRLEIVPCLLTEAHAFVARVHRHHGASPGGLFAVAVACEDDTVGVAVIGRPTSRMTQADGWTCEVTRLAVFEGFPNACSMLYRAAWRGAKALGWRRLVTYTLAEESGSSLRGAGFKCLGIAGGGSWSRKDRPRVDKHPTQEKIKWELTA
jgi:hypothetical protein